MKIQNLIASIVPARNVWLLGLCAWVVVLMRADAAVNWVGASGNWNDAANWEGGALPGPDDDVVIDTPAEITVTHGSGSNVIRSLRCEAALVISGGTLTVSNTAGVNRSFTLSGGTLRAARVLASTNGQPMTCTSGTLDGVVMQRDMEVRGAVTVVNGLEIHGTVELGTTNQNGNLSFAGAQSLLGGEGTVFLRGSMSAGGMLTIGPGITVQCAVAGYTYVRVESPSGYLVNQGTLVAGLPYTRFVVSGKEYLNQGTMVVTNGGTFWVEGLSGEPGEIVLGADSGLRLTGNYTNRQRFEAGTASTLELLGNWVNEGSIVGTNLVLNLGGTWSNQGEILGTNLTLTIQGNWTNAGTFRVTDSTANLGGTWTLATLGVLDRVGGVVNITGTLDNRNGELLIDEERSVWRLNGGTVLGGRVRTVPGVKFLALAGTLDGVVLEGNAGVRTVNVLHDLEIQGVVEVGLGDGLSGALTFVGSQSVLGGEGRVLLKEGGVNVSGGGLTIGPGINVESAVAGSTYVHLGTAGCPLVNQGTVVSGLPYTRFLMNGTAVSNLGRLVITNGGTLWVESLAGVPGDILLGAASQLRLTGSYTNSQRFEAGTASTLELLGNWVNEGSIVGTNLVLNLGGTWRNQGEILGTNLTLTVQGNWTNAGAFRVTDSTANLGGTWTLATLGVLDRVGGVVNITGTLDNRNGELLIDEERSVWRLNGGTVLGGRVRTVPGVKFTAITGTLDGVVLEGEMEVRGAVMVVNGLEIHGTVELGTTNQNGNLSFAGAQSLLGGEGTVFLRGSMSTGGMLTIGPGITVQCAVAGYTYVRVESPSGYLVNRGTLVAGLPYTTFLVRAQQFINTGSVEISGGGTLWIDAEGFSQSGDFDVFRAGSANLDPHLQLDENQRLSVQPGGRLLVASNIIGQVRTPLRFAPLGAVTLDGRGTESNPQLLEVMSQDQGPVPAAYHNNFAYGSLALANNTRAKLVDESDNAPGLTPEALYVNSLVLPAGTTLDLNGLAIYTRSTNVAGTLVGGAVRLVPDSGAIDWGFPTPGALSQVSELDEWTFFGRAGQAVSVVVQTGGAAVPAPALGYAQCRVEAPLGTELASGSNSVSGAAVVLRGLELPMDGVYRVRVQAGPGHANATGNYLVEIWDSTIERHELVLGETVNGTVRTPYAMHEWIFSGVAGQQVRFDLVALSRSGVAFDFIGPNSWTGFTNLTTGSDLLTLPFSGTYKVTAFSTGGEYQVSYAFRLLETDQFDLALGTDFHGHFAGGAQAQLFRIRLPGGANAQITLQNAGAGNQVQLYAGFGQPPTRGGWDYFSGAGSGSSPQLLLSAAPSGICYILVYGEHIPSPGDFVLRASVVRLILSSVFPASAGVALDTTLVFQGAGFDPTTQLEFVGTNGACYAVTNLAIVSYNQMRTTISANSIPPGLYSVRVSQPDGDQAELAGVFEFHAGGASGLLTRLILPTQLGYHMPATLYVEYANTGTVAMPAPLLHLRSADPEGDERPLLTLDPTRVQRGFWSAVLPAGFANSVQFLAGGVIPGWLNPGEGARVAVYYTGQQTPWNLSDRVFEFELRVLAADDLTPIDWAGLKNSLRPEWISPEAWEQVFANLRTQVGATWGDYVRRLQANATYLAGLDQQVSDVRDLWRFELLRAAGLSAHGALAVQADLVLPAPGLPLGIARIFGESVERRYAQGPFGYGWSTMWSSFLRVKPDGAVEIVTPGLVARRFEPRSDSAPGAGTLVAAWPADSGSLHHTADGGFELTEADGLKWRFRQDGRFASLEDYEQNRITLDYTLGRLTKLTHSAGQELRIAHNAAGLIESISDSLGRTNVYQYDAGGHLIEVRDFRGWSTRYAYGSGQGPATEHALTTVTYPDGTHQYYAYDVNGRLGSASRDEGVERRDFSYDGDGIVSIVNALGARTRLFFDHHGAVAKSEDPLGSVQLDSYDAWHRIRRTADAEGRMIALTYACCGLVTARTDPLFQTERFAFAGSPLRMVSSTDPLGNVTRYSYDAGAKLASVFYPDNSQRAVTYDSRGLLAAMIDRRGASHAWQHGADGRLLAYTNSAGTGATYSYDGRGNLLSISNRQGMVRFAYDAADLRTNVTYPNGRSLAFVYDAGGRRIQTSDDTGFAVKYTYDPAGRLATVADGAGRVLVSYAYDAVGRLTREARGNDSSTSYDYDASGSVTNLVHRAPDGSVSSRFACRYDAAGRPEFVTTPAGDYTYEHDGNDQLTRAVFVSAHPGISNQVLTFAYDAAGNRMRSTVNGLATDYSINKLNQYTQVSGGQWQYDAAGNLVARSDGLSTNRYAYDEQDRLRERRTADGVVQYEYDTLDNRMAVVQGSQRRELLVDPTGLGNVFAEYDGTNSLRAHYVFGLGLVCRVDASGQPAYFEGDMFGSVWSLTDASGASTQNYVYGPFGEVFYASGSSENQYQYLGKYGIEHDGQGQYFVRARYYDASAGRFLTPDPAEFNSDSLNLYRYARNSPLTLVDLSGKDAAAKTTCPFRGAIAEITYYIVPDDCLRAHEQKHAEQCGREGFPPGPKACNRQEAEALKVQIDCLKKAGQDSSFEEKQYKEAKDGKLKRCSGGGDPGSREAPPAAPPGGAGGGGSAGGATAQDPNAKTGPGGFGVAGYVEPGRLHSYRVDFENEPTADAPAQEVIIRDQLSPYLDWAKFEWTEVGWGEQWILVPPGRRQFSTNVLVTCCGAPFEVQVNLNFSLASGEATAIFRSINPETGLPPTVAVGFLPPENGTGRGQGHIAYLIQALPDLATGTEIRNIASISFDGQPVITTNQRDPHNPAAGTDPALECLNTLDVTAPSSSVAALPAQLPRGGLVRWSGADVGSGIASYDIYVSEEEGAWTPWLERTALTSAPWLGTVGYRYRFYSVARDNVGLVEGAPAVADAETLLVEAALVLAVAWEGNQVAISFIAESGKRYTLEQRQELGAGTWEPLPGYQNLEGVGEQRVLLDLLPGTPQRFYRLLISSGPASGGARIGNPRHGRLATWATSVEPE